MKTRIEPDRRLIFLARTQAGVLTREQATTYGLSESPLRRLVRDGTWQHLGTGLYFTGAGRPPWLALAWSGVLLGGDQARLAGEAAGHLHGFVAAPRVSPVLVGHGSPRRARGPWEFRQERPGVRRGSRGRPPMIDIEDAVLDLTGTPDSARVIDLVTRAVLTHRTSADRIRRRLAERPRHPQRKLLSEILTNAAEGAESPLELRYLTDVERPHALPPGVRQHRTRGTVRDVLYEGYATVVELDGRTGHDGLERFRDMRRDNRSTLAGEATLRFGWYDVVQRPCLVAAQVALVLARRGWPGPPTSCPRCPPVLRLDGRAV